VVDEYVLVYAVVRILGYDLDAIQQKFEGYLPEGLIQVERVVWEPKTAEAEAARLNSAASEARRSDPDLEPEYFFATQTRLALPPDWPSAGQPRGMAFVSRSRDPDEPRWGAAWHWGPIKDGFPVCAEGFATSAEALGWARARASRVFVNLDGTQYTAGEDPQPGLEGWPPDGWQDELD
jgi:hypothetical protein